MRARAPSQQNHQQTKHCCVSRAKYTRNTRNTRNNNNKSVTYKSESPEHNPEQPGTTRNNRQMTKPLRQSMPETAAFIDSMREAFGAEMINAAIKAGIDGQPTFYASENGQEIGARAPYSAERAVKLSDTLVGPMKATARDSASRKGK